MSFMTAFTIGFVEALKFFSALPTVPKVAISALAVVKALTKPL